VEVAATQEETKYALGSVLNHVLLHQTVVGQEAIQQMEMAGDFPDIVIAPFGGGFQLCWPLLPLPAPQTGRRQEAARHPLSSQPPAPS
jgi:tryptophan synthase beta chain